MRRYWVEMMLFNQVSEREDCQVYKLILDPRRLIGVDTVSPLGANI